ncbi:MAG: bifunctional oligoribonuclease/PAP phosphatase NrnA [Bacteroidales bacterium]|nr:bifunctional oligoribonuclease/PAP phosphatase NrnA [Bacteroidales bacterium]
MEGKDVISGSAFADIISGSRRTVLAVHTHPDGDAIGCGTGLLHFIREVLGKRAVLAVPDAIPDNLLFLLEGLGDSVLVHDSRPEETEKAIAEADLIIGMDISGFDRTGPLKSFLHSSKARKILIDHHLNPDTDAFDVAFSDTEVSSSCELLYRILSDTVQIHGDASLLPLPAATALMTGMTTDTNNFANSVFPGTLRMASDLLSSGVDREMIIDNVYHAYRENRIRLLGFLLYDRLGITPSGAAYMVLTRKEMEDFGISEAETEGFVNIPLSIGKVKISIFLREEDGFFRVSVRSKKGISANALAMKYFNGGGHELAAGGKLFLSEEIRSGKNAEDYVVRVTGEYLEGR